MKLVIIDGQGGKIGKMLIDLIKKTIPDQEIYAIGTNSIATSEMLKAGANYGATGENPVIVAVRDADIVIGPLGIVVANSLLGEITPKMAIAIGESHAKKLLIPINKCNNTVIGIKDLSVGDYIKLTVNTVVEYINK